MKEQGTQSAMITKTGQTGRFLTSAALPLLLAASLLVLLVPMPPAVLDLLLITNITVGILLLLATLTIRTPMELSLFPTLLLVTTLARLVLNVATTRQILTRAPEEGLNAAGSVIRAFGDFVAGGELLVGIIIFAIIVIIQFVVITKGTTRISEVAARFTLDAMPGRQMSIDADLAAGFIDDTEARRRREAISAQADFFGAMDGASKFVRGDAVAGILITLINIFGGWAIGVFRYGMPMGEASEIFTKLTIGDGLTAQIPALLISLAAGVLVTRSKDSIDLSRQMVGQVVLRPVPLLVAGGLLLSLVWTELPTIPLLVLGGCCVALSIQLRRDPTLATCLSDTQETENTGSKGSVSSAEAARSVSGVGTESEHGEPRETTSDGQASETSVESCLAVDPMEVELGVALVPLANPRTGGDLLERIQKIRRGIATELGIVVPKIRIRDNMKLSTKNYRIRIADVSVAEDSLEPRSLLALDPGNASGTLPGIPTRDPAFQTPALWISPDHLEQAKSLGFTVADPATVLSTHLTVTIRNHAEELLSRDAVQGLLDELQKRSPASVDGCVPQKFSIGELQQVLRRLLREQVSIRFLAQILEAMSDRLDTAGYENSTRPTILQWVAAVRERLAPMLSNKYRESSGSLAIITLAPSLERRLATFFHETADEIEFFAPPEFQTEFCQRIFDTFEKWLCEGRMPVLLAGASVRMAVKMFTLGEIPDLVVLAPKELARDARIERLAEIPDWNAIPISGPTAPSAFASTSSVPVPSLSSASSFSVSPAFSEIVSSQGADRVSHREVDESTAPLLADDEKLLMEIERSVPSL
ncbi:MAG: flagellar biosynthesis protein FlhA [Thermoguttaceae bacterium]|nr:flagellar biosynthesis protein FlhA [Thermoguttaceae bacterium]